MKHSTPFLLSAALLISAAAPAASAAKSFKDSFDISRLRYRIDSHSVFNNRVAKESQRINSFLESGKRFEKAASENPEPIVVFPTANEIGDIDAPGGKLWHYTAELDYLEIPPHDNVAFTDRILQEYKFTIYDSDMKVIGVIKDTMDYQEGEERTVLCEITPVATRNFFNTDDTIEIMVALGVNRIEGGNNYRTLVYALDGKTNAEGYNKPIDTVDDLVADVAEGPEIDGKDNYFISFVTDIMESLSDDAEFWDYLLAQKIEINVFSRAIDDKGPRKIYSETLPMIQYPGDQQDVPSFMSLRRGDDVIFCFSRYAEPFYNRYDNPLTDDMTQREGNSLIINLYNATETELKLFSATEIPVTLDPMKDENGNATCLFSYYSIGNLRYTDDILFDAPGVESGKPDFIVTRGNYQISTDDIINSYFTYKNDGSLKNTIFLYSDGTRAMGEIEGFEPQQMFVSLNAYGYAYNFVDLYSAKQLTQIDANYYYDDDSDSELLTSNVDRTPSGDSYLYVFELRYPLVDDYDNDILRFMYINRDGTYNHTENVNMGKGVAYAQSYLSTEALAPHAYSESDTPTFMMLVKRGLEDGRNIEELMVAEAQSEENPDGKTLLQLGPGEYGDLASIVPEFARNNEPGRLLIYYLNYDTNKYTLEIYGLPLGDQSGVDEIGVNKPEIAVEGTAITADGEIKVFSLDGSLVASGIDSVEFASLESGVYVITANGKSFKIAK